MFHGLAQVAWPIMSPFGGGFVVGTILKQRTQLSIEGLVFVV
jgi:hypothetical protein